MAFAIASFVIWMCNNPDWNKSSKAIRRRQLMVSVSLGESLTELLIRRLWTTALDLLVQHTVAIDQMFCVTHAYNFTT